MTLKTLGFFIILNIKFFLIKLKNIYYLIKFFIILLHVIETLDDHCGVILVGKKYMTMKEAEDYIESKPRLDL